MLRVQSNTNSLLDLFLRPVNQSTRAHDNTVVIRTIMVRKISLKHGRHVSDDAKIRRVILAWTCDPRARVLDVYLSGGMHEAESLAGYNWDRVLLVVDVRQVAVVRCVDVIRESTVANPWHTEGECAHACACWHMQREVD